MLGHEALEAPARVFLTVRDEAGEPVRRVEGSTEPGIHRASWDLRRQPPDPVEIDPPGFRPPWAGERQGPLAAPGRYTVELTRLRDGAEETLAPPQGFEVRPVPESSLPIPDFGVVTAFQKETAELVRGIRGAAADLRRVEDLFPYLEATIAETPAAEGALFVRFAELRAAAADLRLRLLGDPIRNRWDEPSTPSIASRAGQVAGGHWDTRQAPTGHPPPQPRDRGDSSSPSSTPSSRPWSTPSARLRARPRRGRRPAAALKTKMTTKPGRKRT